MLIVPNVSLKAHNTFGIAVSAASFCNIETTKDLTTVLKAHASTPIFVLGGGSNVLLTKDIEALVLHINIKGIDIISQTDTKVIVKAMAGENWHQFVKWCLQNDFGGIENLSLIPGHVGTAPIQNIGAYGVELKDTFVSCEAIEIKTQILKTFSKNDCCFGYRDSIFKQAQKDQYIITSVTFELTKNNHNLHTGYGTLKEELDIHGTLNPTIQEVSNAVIAIRQRKLPDPKKIGNSGSFFKNPVVSINDFNRLKDNFEAIPSYQISETEVKIPAGWLIEQAGFKGKRLGNYGVHQKQALVLVNYGGASGTRIYKLAQLIQKTVKRIFDIALDIEVNVI